MACNCGYRKRIREAKTGFDTKRTVYLDYNATTPVDPRVLGEFEKICRRLWANPSSLHSGGASIAEEIEGYTDSINAYFSGQSSPQRPGRFYFCSSGSEAIHAGITGLSRVLSKHHYRHIITTEIEHGAVGKPCRIFGAHPALNKLHGSKPVSVLPVDENGIVDLEKLRGTLASCGPALLVYSPVNHETGGIQPVDTIYSLAKQYDCLVFLDAVQACPRLAPSEWAGDCDAFAVSGHKLYAPKGIAGIYIREGIPVKPFRFGGEQQDGIFPGTENTPGIAALSRAFGLLAENFSEEQRRLSTLTGDGTEILHGAGIEFIIESPGGGGAGISRSVPGVLCLSFPWITDMEEVMFGLDSERICVSRFSACTSRITGPSPVLRAMGRPRRRSETSIRISLGRYSKRDDFFRLSKVLRGLREKQR